jgi:hypothetical protein
MKINKVSIYKFTKILFIAAIFLIIFTILLYFIKTDKFSIILLFALIFFGQVINNLRVFDIYLIDDVILLKGILNQKEINLLNLTVKRIYISPGPNFYVLTYVRR